ncbi:14523_t:CDS:2, partial [Cetraspora pellucida]
KSDNNIATLMEQDNNTFTHNEEVIEDNTLNEKKEIQLPALAE